MNGLLFPTMTLPGCEQMALDVMLLEKALSSGSLAPYLRFYKWKHCCLSIGKNQRNIPQKWRDLEREKKIQMVRRPSGGSAVLHSGGLTYALIWPSPPRIKKEAYLKACEWLSYGFSRLGETLIFGNQSARNENKNCFLTNTKADLIDQNGCKRIGSAQLWKRGYLLQHGEILLDPPEELWMEVFGQQPPSSAPISIPRSGLEKILLESISFCWPEIKWQENYLTSEEFLLIKNQSKNYSLNLIN